MTPFRFKTHIDPETDSLIEETWYRCEGGGLYREVARPHATRDTKLWARLTENLPQPR
jgi:hypothetical protein